MKFKFYSKKGIYILMYKNSIYKLLYISLSILFDFLFIILILKASMYIRLNIHNSFIPEFNVQDLYKHYWICFITLATLIYSKIYFYRYDFWEDIYYLYKALISSLFLVFAMLTFGKVSLEYSRVLIVLFFLFLFLSFPFYKLIVKRFLFSFNIFKIPAFIVAKKKKYKKILKKEIKNNWYLGYRLQKNNCNRVFLVSKGFLVNELEDIIKALRVKTKNIYIIPYAYNISLFNIKSINYFSSRISAIKIENKLLNKKDILIKSIFEKILIFLALPFVLILHIFISILIKLDSKGSVIYKQKRLSKNKKVFYIYKYRTLYENNQLLLDEYLKNNPEEKNHYAKYHKYIHDPRATKVGNILRKTSLDEIPQFFNVILGDMSLIGPRPYMIEEEDKIPQDDKETLLEVKSGITGLWQVSGRNNVSFQDRLKIDKWYVQNWSLWLDIIILFKTIKVILKGSR